MTGWHFIADDLGESGEAWIDRDELVARVETLLSRHAAFQDFLHEPADS